MCLQEVLTTKDQTAPNPLACMRPDLCGVSSITSALKDVLQAHCNCYMFIRQIENAWKNKFTAKIPPGVTIMDFQFPSFC